MYASDELLKLLEESEKKRIENEKEDPNDKFGWKLAEKILSRDYYKELRERHRYFKYNDELLILSIEEEIKQRLKNLEKEDRELLAITKKPKRSKNQPALF